MNQELDMDTITTSPENIHISKNTSLEHMKFAYQRETENVPLIDNVAEQQECFSNFGDDACGEPIMVQRVVINFMPNYEDNDEVSKKCAAFWQFVKEHPELNQFMVKAETKPYKLESTTTESSSSSSVSSVMIKEPTSPDKSAVDMLGFAEKKGLIDRIFEAKLPTRCSIQGIKEYCVSRETVPFGLPKGNPKKAKCVCTCPVKTRSETCDMTTHNYPPGPSCPKAMALCTVLENWDDQHPKSMKQPRHPPCLSHSIMERKIIY